MNLTVKQKKFADYYIQNGNAKQSYINAGYKAHTKGTAEVNGCRLLSNAKVQEYIQEVNHIIQSARIADMKEVKEFWTNTLRDNELDLKERIKVSELIGKTNGAFLDKIEHSGGIGLVVKWADKND